MTKTVLSLLVLAAIPLGLLIGCLIARRQWLILALAVVASALVFTATVVLA